MPENLEIPPPGYRVARRPAVDPATRRLALIAVGIGGALVVLVGLWSMLGGKTSGVPVVASPPGAMRVKPANPGGMQVAGATEPILGGVRPSAKPALAPPPETPDLRALRNPPATSMPATAPAVTGASAATSGSQQLARMETPAPTVPAAPATADGLPLPPPAPPPLRLAAASVARPLPLAVGTGTATEVQLAAMSSESGATREWQDLQTALPDLFGHRRPLITKVEIDGHTFWRVRTGGFANIAAATQFCAMLRSKGKACTIASF